MLLIFAPIKYQVKTRVADVKALIFQLLQQLSGSMGLDSARLGQQINAEAVGHALSAPPRLRGENHGM
jgi:hypothetical protein